MVDLTSEIKAFARREGVSLIGIAPARGWRVARGHRPRDVLSDAESVVVMAKQIADRVIDQATTGEIESTGLAILKEMDQVGAKIVEILVRNGYIGVPIENVHFPIGVVPPPYRTPEYFRAFAKHPSHKEQLRGVIPLKYAAQMAGIGAIGKSSLLITLRYGPSVRLSAIVTNAPLAPDKPLNAYFCQGCTVCEDVCIAEAFREGRHDPELCWRGNWELGDHVPGKPYTVCAAPCVKFCPARKLKDTEY